MDLKQQTSHIETAVVSGRLCPTPLALSESNKMQAYILVMTVGHGNRPDSPRRSWNTGMVAHRPARKS